MRREIHYPERFTVSVSTATREELRALAAELGLSPGIVARRALEAGLPVLRSEACDRHGWGVAVPVVGRRTD